MMNRQFEPLIERWARAAQAGDIEGVLVDHTADIVMFDVPPPEAGVRGIEAYRQTWPPFFKTQDKDGVFEIVSLDVTDGADVAFAHALLRCGTQEELTKRPEETPASHHGSTQGERPVAHYPRASLLHIGALAPHGEGFDDVDRDLTTAIIGGADAFVSRRAERPACSEPMDRRTILAGVFQIRGAGGAGQSEEHPAVDRQARDRRGDRMYRFACRTPP